MQAFWEAGDYDTAHALAIEAAYRSMPDGRLAAIGTMEAATDPCSVGEVMQLVAKKYNNSELEQSVQGLLKWALTDAPRNKNGVVYHMTDLQEFWVDSLYMLPPFLAAMGQQSEAIKQINGYWKALYLPAKKLLAHRANDQTSTFVRADAWGTGNGWAMAALCRVIDLLDESQTKERNTLIEINTDLIQTVANHIRPDGLAHDILDDPKSFLDTALPMLLAYSIYRATKSGWLKNDELLKTAEKCQAAAHKKVDPQGFIRDVAGAPHFMTSGISPEAQAFFILMEAAREKL